jgi:hypothetical protein
MNSDEVKQFLEKIAGELNKKLVSVGHKAVVVPGTKDAWEINCLTPKGLYSMSYYFSAGNAYYKPDGEHQLFMQMPPNRNFIAYPRTDAAQSLLVASRRLATIAFNHIVENESRQIPTSLESKAPKDEEIKEDITSDRDYDEEIDFEIYNFGDSEAELENERRQREEAEKSASNWKSAGIVLLVIFVIAGLSRCGGQSLPDNCEYIQDERGGYTECN